MFKGNCFLYKKWWEDKCGMILMGKYGETTFEVVEDF